jgi:alkaline phosphatase
MKLNKLFIGFLAVIFSLALNAKQPKYVFLFIGDGMAANHRVMTDQFSRQIGRGPLAMDQLTVKALTTTLSADKLVTDSAAAATALACGVKAKNSMLGCNAKGKYVPSCATLAKKSGKKVGIITTVTTTHATPGGFYVRGRSRGKNYDVAADLVNSGFDFFAGGGLDRKFNDTKNPNYKKYGNIYEYAKKKGYKVVTNKKEFLALKRSSGKVLTRFTDLVYPYDIDIKNDELELYPTVAQLLKKCVEVIDNPKGFFIMVEGGRIDWSAHANDAATTVRDIVALDDAVRVALEFMKKHPNDTLIVATGDHETGGLTAGVAGVTSTSDISILTNQTTSIREFDEKMLWVVLKNQKFNFEDGKKMITKSFGLKFEGDPKKDLMVLTNEEIAKVKADFEVDLAKLLANMIKKKDAVEYLTVSKQRLGIRLGKLISKRAGVSWAHTHHSGQPVILSAEGCCADLFKKDKIENSEVGKILKSFYQNN